MPRHPVVGPEWITEAPIRVEQSIDIAAAPAAVWPHIADHERWPEWFTELDRIERIGSGEGVRSGRRVTARRLTIDEEFTAWDENERFAFAVVKSPIPVLARLAEEVVLEQVDHGTRVTYRQGVEGKRFVGGVMALIWKRAPAQVAAALAALKTRVEA
ncbi:MAG: SRPBCC family protein [Actinomycetota bacterium]